MTEKRGVFVVFLYVGYLLIAAVHPFEFSLDFSDRLSRFLMTFLTAPRWGNEQLYIKAIAEKFLLHVPCGILLYYWLTFLKGPRGVTIILASICAGLISFFIELSQVFFPGRHPSSLDVFIKCLGGTCGALIAGFCPIQITKPTYRFWRQVERSKLPLFVILLYAALPCIFFIARYPWLDFSNWDSRFTFQIGNEATLDQPWLGKIFLVALYDRVLSPDEIAQHFNLGSSPEPLTRRVEEGLIALYTFDEGTDRTVHDVSTFDSPLDLTFSDRSHMRWLPASNGIEILQPAIAKTQGPAKKLFRALSAAAALSIEVWISPRNTAPIRPARIVSLSRDAGRYNFSLWQQGADIRFQLRTPILGRNGSAIYIKTRDKPLTPEMFHIVTTYKEGREKLYVNGRERPDDLDLTTDVLVSLAARKSPLAQMAYSFFYFYPVSFFLSVFLSTRSKGTGATLLLPIAIGAGLLSITEISQAFAFGRIIDLPLIGYGVLTATVATFSGAAFVRAR